jgi:hypothetical protein
MDLKETGCEDMSWIHEWEAEVCSFEHVAQNLRSLKHGESLGPLSGYQCLRKDFPVVLTS